MRILGIMEQMAHMRRQTKIIIVDDEWDSAIIKAVQRRLEAEGWATITIEPEASLDVGGEFELAALYSVETEHPDAVILDVRFGEHRDERFKGLGILGKIVKHYPKLPVLMFTQYAQGPDREMAVRGSLKWDAPVDFIDKLASPEEVVLRLRRLIGIIPKIIQIGSHLYLDTKAKGVFVKSGKEPTQVEEIRGTKFEILCELAAAWYRSPGESVPFTKLERYLGGEDARASLRVRIREIKDSLGKGIGLRLGADDLIINIRDHGYRLLPPRM